jgi:hypothetical protein
MDDERRWLEDEPRPRRPSRRAITIGAAAMTPWIAIAAIVLGGDRGVPHEPEAWGAGDPVAGHQGADRDTHHAPPVTESAPPPVDEVTIVQLQGGWRDSPGPTAAGAVATIAARAWLTGHGPRLTIDGLAALETDLYVEHLAVEAIEQTDAQVAVVSLLAVVLRGDPLTVEWRRLAVPVRVDGDAPRPAGEPWWLPEPAMHVAPIVGEPVDDPSIALEVVEALEVAGYRDVVLHALERTEGWPWRAHVEATTPGGRAVETPVLLRRHPQGFAVAGVVDTSWR